MSKTDEMFKELGYEEKEYNKEVIFYFQRNGFKEEYGFEFNNIDREIYPVCYGKNDEAIYITMQELQAINEKGKELGWNE